MTKGEKILMVVWIAVILSFCALAIAQKKYDIPAQTEVEPCIPCDQGQRTCPCIPYRNDAQRYGGYDALSK